MSILDALKVQKANQQSITDLAALPQNEIIRLAQMGHIPADVVPVVISEKARMAKETANMRAAAQMQQQGGRMPTVIEQAMQANAQAEAPQMPPQQPGLPGAMPGAQAQAPMQMPPQAQPQAAPAEAGVAGLPTGQMFQGQNFQAGGIVGYNGEEGSFVETPGGLNVLKEELQPKAPGAMPTSLAEYIKQVQEASAPFRALSQEEKDRDAALAKGMSQGEKDQQKYMRLLEAGLGIMGGESPYGFTNIGKGSQAALKGYGEDVREQQKQKMEELKSRAEAAKAKRLEGLEDVKTGSALYKEYMQNEAAAQRAKDGQLGAKFADNYVAMKKAGGDQRPDEVIRDEGYRQFFQEYGFASGRAATQAQIAAGAQGVQAAGITERYANQAQDSVDKTLGKVSSPESIEYRKLKKEDPAKAAEYRQTLINQRARELASAGVAASGGGAPAPAAPAARPAPSAPIAMPKTKAELKDGTVYSTSRGPARWDAAKQQFFLVK